MLTTVDVRLVLDHDGEELPADWRLALAADLEGESVLGNAAVIEEVSFEVDAVKLSEPGTPALGPFVRDSSTSRRAALDNYPRQGSQRWRIIRVLFGRGPGTRDWIAHELGLTNQSVTPRVLELVRGGWVRETDREAETRSGSMATVVELTEKAREYIAKNGDVA